MNTFQKILLSTALFLVLFYEEEIGLNVGILAIAYSVLTLITTPKINKTHSFFVVFVICILSAFAFAWYGDEVSFVAVFSSVALLSFKSKSKELKSILAIPAFAITFFAFIYRVFLFDQWFPKVQTQGSTQKVLAVVVVPALLLMAFFGIYSAGSDHFAQLLKLDWNINFWLLTVISCLGFFFAFNFFNLWIPDFLFKQNHFLKNDFLQLDRTAKPTYSFLDIDAERMSGVVSLIGLNILLVFFIITYNYEQFFENVKSPVQLSQEIHERVNAVIISILMAIVVILFYFKSGFNFDEKSKTLKVLAKIWIVLNGVLVFSALGKNVEYFVSYGATYKRFGVFAFLVLSVIGLFFTFLKIQKQRTNAYLINHMTWYFYGTVLAASFINWGGIATSYNIENKKGDFNFLMSLKYNDNILEKHFPYKFQGKYNPNLTANGSFLSKILYYESLKK